MKPLKSWFNKVFCQNVTPDTSKEVVNTSDNYGISETILSFIEVYRSNPERFIVESIGTTLFFLFDTVTKDSFTFNRYVPNAPILYCNNEILVCFSKRELIYLWLNLIEPEHRRYTKVYGRLENIKRFRKLRLQREQLRSVYCGET
jgi:hypothetical protein